jgi:predicted PurR-regulated permease PerM
LTAQQTFRNTLIVIGTLAAAYLLLSSIRILIVLFLAITIASALRKVVVRLMGWRLPQGGAILMVYGGLLISIVALSIIVLTPVVTQLSSYLLNEDRLINRLLYSQMWLERSVSNLTGTAVTFIDADDLRAAVTDILSTIREISPTLVGDLSGTLGNALLVFIMGVYWLTSRDKIADFIVDLLALRNREKARHIIEDIETGIGSYVRGVFMVAAIITTLTGTALAILGVANAFALGLIIGVMTMLPVIGTVIGGIVATLLALLDSPSSGVIVLVVFLIAQQIESNVLTPRMMARSMGIDPLLVIISIFTGFALYGVVGGIIAVPLVGTITTLIRYLVIEPRREQLKHKVESGAILLNTGEPEPLIDSQGLLLNER